MALNMWKMSTSSSKISPNNKTKERPSEFFKIFKKFEWSSLKIETYVTASSLSVFKNTAVISQISIGRLRAEKRILVDRLDKLF